MKEAYCSFEVAKLLKEKGFDWKCNSHYWAQDIDTPRHSDYPQNWNCASDDWYSRPTHQMAMKWLREKHIIIVPTPDAFFCDGSCICWKCDIWADDNYEQLDGLYATYEETVEESLKYCLENII